MQSKPRRYRILSSTVFATFLGLATVLGVLAYTLELPTDVAHAEDTQRAHVPKALIRYDDGDTITILWPGKDAETVRILGIDTPEVLHLEHDIPYPQAFGYEAAGFLRGCIAACDRVELLRADGKDRYGRTLAYVLVDGKNYSVLVIAARLAYGPNPKYGDNGLPKEYAACIAAVKTAGPPAFEKPWLYRQRMRKVSAFMKKQGSYPHGPSQDSNATKK